MQNQPRHIFHFFAASVRKNFSKDALLSAREAGVYHSETYGSVYRKALFFADLLKSLNLEPGDRVAILLDNRPEFSWVCFAVLLAGGVIVPMDTQYSSDILQNLLSHCGARILISTEKFRHGHARISSVRWISIDSSDVLRVVNKAAEGDRQPEGELDLPSADIAALFYTSGTTAQPKAVMLTHRNLLANVEAIQRSGLVGADDVVLSMLPLHHTYAFTVTLLCPLLCGMSIAYPKSLASVDLVACVKLACVSVFVGVPQVFAMIHRVISDQIEGLGGGVRSAVHWTEDLNFLMRHKLGMNLGKNIFRKIHQRFGPSLRVMVSGGARLDPRVARDFYRWGFTLVEGYGLTETSPVVSFSIPEKPRFGSVGKPLGGVEIRIDRPDEQGVGEVVVRGDNVMRGYYKMDAATREVIQNGWFFTGDLGYIDGEGFLFLTGRKKEMLVLTNGENIHPEELEQYYGQNPFLKEIAVLTVQDPKRPVDLTQLTAIIVPDDERFREAKELNIRQRIRWELENDSAKLPSYKRIKGFVVSQEALPRTRLGKLRRFELEKIYYGLKDGNVEPPKEFLVYSESLKDVIKFVEKKIGRPVSPSDHLELDLGLDSLARLDLFTSLQERLHLRLTEQEMGDFFACSTVGQVLDKLKPVLENNSQGAGAGREAASSIETVQDLPLLALSHLEECIGFKVSLTDHLELDLGLDSLGRAGLLLGIQQKLGLDLSDEDALRFFMCARVSDLMAEMKRFAATGVGPQGETASWKDVLSQDLSAEDAEKVQIGPLNILQRMLTYCVKGALRVVFRIFWKVEVEGLENLPSNGPYILCPNHASYFDGLFITDALPMPVLQQTFFLGDSRFLEHWAIRPFRKTARLIPITFSHRMAEALTVCAYILRHNKVLCYFSEGQRSIDGSVQAFRKGIGVLIHELGVPAVPVYIKGAFEFWPRGQKWPKIGPRISVVFGKPVSAKELAFRLTEAADVYQRIANNLRGKVLEISRKA